MDDSDDDDDLFPKNNQTTEQSSRRRKRPARRPVYNMDDSDFEDDDLLSNDDQTTEQGSRRRKRPARRPVYTMDDSDFEDDDLFSNDDQTTEQVEGITERGMGSFAGRLRKRPDRRPFYTMDDYEDDDDLLPKHNQTADHVEGIAEREEVNPLTEMEKILDCEMRPTASTDPDSDNVVPKEVLVKQYLVKWKGLSYLHCSWVLEQDFHKAYKSIPRLKTRVNKFHSTMKSVSNNGDDFVAIPPEWTTVDRIIDCRGEDDDKEYLVKYKELSYDECYWESESDISTFQNEIQRFKDINSDHRKDKYVDRDHQDLKQFDHTPEFLTGSLHPYQLEGLNFLRFSWSKQTHVILADEMGLGKTIQSIAFLASLFEENLAPYLVVAPLSTLRNWEREFATWAPQMNVVMYVGTSQARSVIREHEFYFPKDHDGISGESDQNRIKFDVILTSYEMINLDTGFLKQIKWKCIIVDEGHRLKNKDSKLFHSLKQYTSKHRVLLTGTPLQNNLDELFVLMHFLDAEKFDSLEEFQEQFKDIDQEEKISRLHQMLAPHLLRRVKKDVLKDMPLKKELIVRVDLSSQQREIYKAIMTRSYKILTKTRAKVSNLLMELRKICLHPYMMEGVEPEIEDANEAFKQLLESSGKMQLLDQMMVKLKTQGHRVLVYSQFQHMLDLLEYYCTYKNWFYERIDGKVSGADRQARIDRFNAKDSNRFCFLLSTRAGGLGINLATADTVFIYDSDWNPHADLQAMARAHRLGQKNNVLIYRLISRGTIEEKMVEISKKKMLLEHLVVGNLKATNLSQEELDDIIRYGSKELFSDENEEAGKFGKIHYDDAAIEKLLDCDHLDAEEVSVDDGFLKAFKVANFEYIDDNEAAALEEAQATENKSSAGNSDRENYWKKLLKDKYEVHQAEETNALGKGKRSRKQRIELDYLAGFEASSDDEAESSDDEADELYSVLNRVAKRPYTRRTRDNSEPIPLIEGQGTSLKVLGFNETQRKTFLKTLMRYGVGNYDWKEYIDFFKQKTYDEIKNYGTLFLKHIAEDTEASSSTFSDGVPKEGLNRTDVLIRIAVMMLVQEKVKFLEDHPSQPIFPDRILEIFPELAGGDFWKEEHDKILLLAVSKHGFGKWINMVEDTELGMEEIICREWNVPYIPLTTAQQAGLPESSMNQDTGPADGGYNYEMLEFRDPHRKLGDFLRRRFYTLKIAMNYECAEEYYGQYGSTSMRAEQVTVAKATKELLDRLPKTEPITSENISAAAVDNKQESVEVAELYDQMRKNLSDNSGESIQTYLNRQPLSTKLRENFGPLKFSSENISRSPSAIGTNDDIEKEDSKEKAAEEADIEVIVLD